MTRIRTLVGLCVTAIVTSAVPALAQGPTITSPTPNQVFRAGPDYASDILHDPWDFDNVEDIGQYPYEYLGWAQSANAFAVGPSAFGVGSGKFIATNASNDPHLGLLYPGGIGIPNPGRSGQRYPVSTSLYRKLAFRIKVSNAQGSQAALYWYPGGVGSAPGFALSPVAVTNGEGIYQIDLAANHAGGPAYTSQPHMVGFRLDPISESSSANVELDWVRLTASDGPSAAMMPISASNCGGSVNVDVQDATGLWATVGTSLSFNYGILPPGNYLLRVRCNGSPSNAVPFTINDPPRIAVLQPDERGGIDYATAVRGNPWDMDDASDAAAAANLDQGAFVASPSGGLMLRGRNVLNANPSITGDPNVFLLYSEGAGRPIASTRYRYLTFTTQLHHPFDLALGSVARVGWASAFNWDGFTASGTKDILVWPGRNTYTIDLGALTLANGLEACPAGAPCKVWTQSSPRFLRFDPHEFSDRQVVFDLDNVTLAAPDEVWQGGTFPIQWLTQAGPGSVANIYLDLNATPGGEALIGSVAASLGTFNWQANVPPGEYYVFVQIVEPVASSPPSSDTRGAYSTGVLRVLPAGSPGVVSIATPVGGSSVNAPFNISGCAHNGAGGADDEVVVYAHPLQGQMGGVVQILGLNPLGGLGSLGAAPCAGGLPGYQVTGVTGLPAGLWTIRVLGRNTLTGDFEQALAQNVNVSLTAGAARNFRATISGNTVALAWDPPIGGSVTQYRIESASNPSFSVFSHATLPASQTSVTATLPNGIYYMRVVVGNTYSDTGPASNVINFVLPGGSSLSPPGAITLGGQLNANPVSLNWSQAGGGAATYALHAGTGPGLSNLAVVPMGAATSLPPTVVPVGVAIYARIVASNGAGSAVSNEVVVSVPAPGPPGGPPIQLNPTVSGHTVTIRWNPPVGGAVPTSYAIVARLPGSSAILAAATGLQGTSLTVPGVPTAQYVLTIVAMYGATPSIESNQKTLIVP